MEHTESPVPGFLRQAAETYEARNKVYGDNYKRFGAIMAGIFPSGITLLTPHDWNQMGIFVQIISKATRYANNINIGGHDDSLLDMSVYANMLREIDSGNEL